MPKTLHDISEAMRNIDFCMLVTRAQDGSLGGRPMSNNQDIEYDGDNWFFTYDDTRLTDDIARDASVGLTYRGAAGLKGLVGAPGLFIHVEGEATLVRDKQAFAEHWDDSLERWFEQGIDTPGMVLVAVRAKRIHYWDGEDEGEVPVPNPA